MMILDLSDVVIKCYSLYFQISEAVLNNIEKKILTFKTANTLISILSSEVENLTPQHQVALTKTCLNMIFTTPDTEGYNW